MMFDYKSEILTILKFQGQVHNSEQTKMLKYININLLFQLTDFDF